MVSRTDRTGYVTALEYDDTGRLTQRTLASGTAVAVEHTYQYLSGSDSLVTSAEIAGETRTTEYDEEFRVVRTTNKPDGATTLELLTRYDANRRVDFKTDPYGRRVFIVYDRHDRPARTVAEMSPNSLAVPDAANYTDPVAYLTARDAYLSGLARPAASNALYLITDYSSDVEGQLTTTTDPRGVVTSYAYDDQGRQTATVLAVGTPVEARSEADYDDQGNVVEARSPRYFDATDAQGHQKAKVIMTYTSRNLLASRTVAPGTPEEATTSYTYFLDKRADTTTDARGNAWSKLWGVCCARIMATIDPPAAVDGDPGSADTRAATITRHDFYGNLTHQGRVTDVSQVDFPNTPGNPTVFTDLPDSDTLQEVTTRYDARHRPIATTTWLVPLPGVDPDNVPIAGGGETGDPAVDIAGVTQGLTTIYEYDDDLADGQGLDAPGAYGTTISAKLPAGFYAAGSDGYGVAVINPEGETSVRFVDALGRTVLSIDGEGNASTMDYDNTIAVANTFNGGASGGTLLRTIGTTPLGFTSEDQSDGAGRTLRSLDADDRVTTASYDGQSNRVAFRDPMAVGEDCTFDERGRKNGLCGHPRAGRGQAAVLRL